MQSKYNIHVRRRDHKKGKIVQNKYGNYIILCTSFERLFISEKTSENGETKYTRNEYIL